MHANIRASFGICHRSTNAAMEHLNMAMDTPPPALRLTGARTHMYGQTHTAHTHRDTHTVYTSTIHTCTHTYITDTHFTHTDTHTHTHTEEGYLSLFYYVGVTE